MSIPTEQEFNDAKVDLDDLEAIVNGSSTVTTRLGGDKLSVDQALSQIITGEVTVYNAATTYTGIEEWVEFTGVVYRPLPSALPIGPEAFNAANWSPTNSNNADNVEYNSTTVGAYLDNQAVADYTAFKNGSYKNGDIVDVAYRDASQDVESSGGSFYVTDADLTTEKANDPLEGVYVDLGGGLTGIRRNMTGLLTEYFGVVANEAYNDTPAFQACINYALKVSAGIIYLLAKVYRIESSLTLINKRSLKFQGAGFGGNYATSWSGVTEHNQTNIVWFGGTADTMFDMQGMANLTFHDIDFCGANDGVARLNSIHRYTDPVSSAGFATGQCDYQRCSFYYALEAAIDCGGATTEPNCSDMTFQHIVGTEFPSFLRVRNDQGINYVTQYVNVFVTGSIFHFDRGGVLNAQHTSGGCDYVLRIDRAGLNVGSYILNGVRTDGYVGVRSKLVYAPDNASGKKSVIEIVNPLMPSGQPAGDALINIRGSVQVNVRGGLVNNTDFIDIGSDTTAPGGSIVVCDGTRFDTTSFALSDYVAQIASSDVVLRDCSDSSGRVIRNTNDTLRTGYQVSVVANTPYSSSTRIPVNNDLAPDRNKTAYGRRGFIRGVAMFLPATLSAGTIKVRVMKNGAGIASTEATVSSSEQNGTSYMYFNNPTVAFTESDFLEVQYETDSSFVCASPTLYATLITDMGLYM